MDGLEAAKALYGGLPTPEPKEKDQAAEPEQAEEDSSTDNRNQAEESR